MSYIGNTPAEKYQTLQKQSFTTSATTSYTLSYSVTNPQEIALFINNVRQNPNSSYTVSGTTLTLSSATTGTDVMYAVFLGKSVGTIAPALGSVTRNMLANPWQSVQTTAFTAVAGYAYPCNTTSAAFTVTLPSSASVGDTIALVDYAGTFATNNITLTSSLNIEGSSDDKYFNTTRIALIFTYIDSTQGWLLSSGYSEAVQEPYQIDFLTIAGGAGGGSRFAGGGGAGGYRNSYDSETSGGGGSSESNFTTIIGVPYTITIGAGGAGGVTTGGSGTEGAGAGSTGSNSVISGTGITTITSSGGGGGGRGDTGSGASGGSGGGAAGRFAGSAGAGTLNQGYAGGSSTGASPYPAGGGGGAGAVGESRTNQIVSGAGGAGLASTISGSSVTRAGGGGGSAYTGSTQGAGGAGGGGAGGITSTNSGVGNAGTSNTGSGGGGGVYDGANKAGGNGGSGAVILRMPTVSYSGTTTGSPTVSTSGTDTILIYNASGSYTG